MIQRVCTKHKWGKITFTDTSGTRETRVACVNCGINKNTIKSIKQISPLKFKRKPGRPNVAKGIIAKEIVKDYRKLLTRKRNKLVDMCSFYSGENLKSLNLAITLMDLVLNEELILNEDIIKSL